MTAPVADHACTPQFDGRMMPIAYDSLCHLRGKGLRVAQQQVHHRPATIELLLKQLPLKPITVPSTLDHSPARCGFASHEPGNAEYPFFADNGNLCRGAIFHDMLIDRDGLISVLAPTRSFLNTELGKEVWEILSPSLQPGFVDFVDEVGLLCGSYTGTSSYC